MLPRTADQLSGHGLWPRPASMFARYSADDKSFASQLKPGDSAL